MFSFRTLEESQQHFLDACDDKGIFQSMQVKAASARPTRGTDATLSRERGWEKKAAGTIVIGTKKEVDEARSLAAHLANNPEYMAGFLGEDGEVRNIDSIHSSVLTQTHSMT
jgi:hypothetical protein